MPTVAEMELLNRSMSDLAGTLQRNRALNADERERRMREALERESLGLRREELGLRREDQADARKTRQMGLDAAMKHQGRLEALQKEENADKRAKLGMDFLAELNKSGQLTDEGIAAMQEAFSKQFAPAGLQVKLFRAAEPAAGSFTEDPETGERFYNRGKQTFKSGTTRAEVTEEEDPLTGETKRRVKRRVKPGELDAAMRGGAGSTAGMEEPEPEDLPGDRIPVHGPPGLPAELSGAAPRVRPAAEPETFETEAAARKAGRKAGDVVRLVLNGKPTLVRLK